MTKFNENMFFYKMYTVYFHRREAIYKKLSFSSRISYYLDTHAINTDEADNISSIDDVEIDAALGAHGQKKPLQMDRVYYNRKSSKIFRGRWMNYLRKELL